MLYMFGKVILYGISFNIVYNESSHKNMKTFKYFIFSQSSGTYINLFRTEMEVHEPALCCHTHVYLSNRTLHIQIIS